MIPREYDACRVLATASRSPHALDLDNRTVAGFATKTGKIVPPSRAEKHGRLSSRRYRCANQKRNLHLRNLHVLQLL